MSKPEPKLEPCPFCYERADIVPAAECGDGAYVVQCSNAMCSASSKVIFATKDDPTRALVDAWNARISKFRALEDLRRIHAMSHAWGEADGIHMQSDDSLTVKRVRTLLWLYHDAEKRADELLAALQGLSGLCTLLLARTDLPKDVREVLTSNHRVQAAHEAVARTKEKAS